MIAGLKIFFKRDLEKLRKEIELYKTESNIWVVEKDIANSAGNLCLHLVGNLNMFIGNVLGNTGYVRNRDAEFSLKNIPRQELLQKIDSTINMIDATLDTITEGSLQEEFPVLAFNERTTKEHMFMHLVTHLSYHLGQVNYHRRLLDK